MTQIQKVEIKEFYSDPQPEHIVLWVSRHPPIKAQIETLKKKLGSIKVLQVSGLIPSAEFVAELVKKFNAQYVVPVLPLSFIARLSELARKNGFTLLWAEMEMVKQMNSEPKPNVDYNPENEVFIKGYEGTYKIMRFKQFHVIKAVKLELEPW